MKKNEKCIFLREETRSTYKGKLDEVSSSFSSNDRYNRGFYYKLNTFFFILLSLKEKCAYSAMFTCENL